MFKLAVVATEQLSAQIQNNCNISELQSSSNIEQPSGFLFELHEGPAISATLISERTGLSIQTCLLTCVRIAMCSVVKVTQVESANDVTCTLYNGSGGSDDAMVTDVYIRN